MANSEELKTMIKCFRIHELQALLSFAGRSKVGKKHELQNRALTLLKLESEPLAIKIKHLYYSMQSCYSTYPEPFTDFEVTKSSSSISLRSNVCKGQDIESLEIIDGEMDDGGEKSVKRKTRTRKSLSRKISERSCSSRASLKLTLNPLFYPLHPKVKFKKLPFYKVLHELLKPSSLIPSSCEYQQKNYFEFHLTPQQAATIKMSQNMEYDTLQQSTIQSQLRFCLFEKKNKQDDCYPPGLVVRVNNKYCTIQEFTGRKKKDVYVKETAFPINITSFIKTNSRETNNIEIQWNTGFRLPYVAAIYMVQKEMSEDLLSELKSRAVYCADFTKKMIEEQLQEEGDNEIVTTSLRVSLMCPVGKIRLNFPCRASTCQHLQCFDALLFLQMNEKKPTWMCPVCDNPAEYDKLVIDGYFQEILCSDKLPSEANEVELHSDGSWSYVLVKTEQNLNSERKEGDSYKLSKNIIDVVLEDNSNSSPPPPPLPPGEETEKEDCSYNRENTSAVPIVGRKIDEIDLTISDSDDEPLIWYKRRESAKLKNKDTVTTTTQSTWTSPSVITLDDSDSSDSLSVMISNSIPQSLAPAVPDITGFSTQRDLLDTSSTSKMDDSSLLWFTESSIYF